MKKLPFVLLCSLLLVSSSSSILMAQVPPDAALDPEPPVKEPPPGFEPEAIESIAAVLEPAWTAPVMDLTYSLAWGDYDRDGYLDLLVGNFGDNRLYRNDGGTLTETLTLVCDAAYPDNSYSVAWGDYDRDGYLDIAVGNFGSVSCIFRNELGEGGGFDKVWQAEFTQNTTSVAWAGWDIGGEYFSYLAMGFTDDQNAIYRYEAGDFDLWWTDPTDATTYDLAWGDYDQDGYPDLAMGNFGQANVIYHNDGLGLTPVFTTAAVSYTVSVAWGDVDGDGDMDLAVGNNGSTGVTDPDQVYCNGGPPTYTFSLCWTSDDGTLTTQVAWGDYDGDGDLDLAAASEPDGVTRIYLNDGAGLKRYSQWDANDEASNSQAVTWSDWDGDGDMELTIGYYNGANVLYDNTQGAMIPTAVSADVLDTRSVAWGDLNGDGLLDLAVGNSSGAANQVFTSTGEALTLAWTSPDGQNSRSVAWGDFDGDGDMDLAVGNGQQGGGVANQVFCNNSGNLALCDAYGNENTYSVAWGDFDGDQDLDLAVGNFEADQANYVYINGLSGGVLGFTGTYTLPWMSDQTLSVAWGDFDQDHDLDLAVGNHNGPDRVLVNSGGAFPQIITLPHDPDNDDTRSVAWGDWDDDGDLDLVIGNAGADGFVQILAADVVSDTWTFTPAFTSTESFLDVRSVAWGDYDGDGDLDLAVGVHGQWGKRNLIYRNIGGSMMVKAWTAPAAEADATRSVAWGDYDNDGDLDLATGNVTAPASPNRLFVNNWNGETNLANDPTYVVIEKPGLTDDAWFFANHEIIGRPAIDIWYTLYDDEGDRAFLVEPWVSWNGGDHWEPAWEAGGEGTENLDASPAPTGTQHLFVWDALNQLLAHQGQSIPVTPLDETWEEMDVAFRLKVWSNPEHGGLIQRPAFGSDTTLFRVDMRPDWYDSVKLADPQIVHPGETIEYTILVTQTDHGMPPQATITDVLPPELSLYAPPFWNLDNLQWATDRLTWTGDLDFEEQLFIRFNPEVTLPLTNGLVITNCAYFFDGLHPTFTRCATAVISSTPTLTTSWKLVNDQPFNTASPGDPLTYTLILTNTGTDNARDAILTDSLPANLLWADGLTATSGVAAYADGTVTWQGDVKVYEPVTITFYVTVVKPLPGNTIITNTAWVSDQINPPFFLRPVTTTVLAPDLRSSAKIPSAVQVELSDVLTYTIILTNNGALDASPVHLDDLVPQYTTYVSGSLWFSEGGGGYDPASDAITWTGAVSVGSPVTVTFAVTIEGPPDLNHPVITNTAEITDPVGGPVTLVATTTVWLPDLSPSTKTDDPATVELDDWLTYTLVLSNTGGYAPQVRMDDPIPQGCQYIPGTLWSSDGDAGYDPQTKTITWTGNLTASHAVTVTFAVTASCPASVDHPVITNTATVQDSLNRSFALVETTRVRLSNLSLSTKTAHAPQVAPGEPLTYTVILRNTGGNAPLVQMDDPIPQGSEFIPGALWASSGNVGYDPQAQSITWMGSLTASHAVTVTFAVTAGCPVSLDQPLITNTATVQDSLNRSFALVETTDVQLPNLSLSEKTVQAPQAAPGGLLTYTVIIRNTGGHAPAVYMRETLPSPVSWMDQYTVSQGTANYDPFNHQLAWTVGDMAGGDVAAFAFAVRIDPDFGPEEITNEAEIGYACDWLTREATIFVPFWNYLPLVLKNR